MTKNWDLKSLVGILVLDKPSGISSTSALEEVKKILRVKKAGHGGTLDPLATGVLPIFLNSSTKVAQIFLEGDKVYEGSFKIGITTDTYDITGEILAYYDIKDITLEKLKEVAQSFVGEIEQYPPPYSAVKLKGRPLYKYARDGLLLSKEPKKVKVYQFEILSLEEDRIFFKVKCSKGTYVRSLIHQLGEKLGCGGVLYNLRRLQKSIFTIEEAITFEELKEIVQKRTEDLSKFIISLSKALEFLPKILVSDNFSKKIKNGVPIPTETFLSFLKFQKFPLAFSEKWIRIFDSKGNLLAIVENSFQQKGPYIKYFRVFKDGL